MNSSYKELKENFINKIEEELKESDKRLKKAKLSLKGYKKGVVTLGIVSPENPLGKKASDKENQKKKEEFLKEVSRLKIPKKELIGFYGGEENSFLLFNVSLETIKYFAQKYEQEFFIFGSVSFDHVVHYKYYEVVDKNSSPLEYVLKNRAKEVLEKKDAKNFYSVIKSKEGRNYKFTIPFNFEES